MAITSQGIKLSYMNVSGGGTQAFVELNNLLEIPELGEGERDTIEITTLADDYHKYTDGLKNFADGVTFKFLYDKTQFETLNKLEGTNGWQVALPDGLACTFSATSAVKLDGVGTNAAMTFTLTLKPTNALVWGTAV